MLILNVATLYLFVLIYLIVNKNKISALFVFCSFILFVIIYAIGLELMDYGYDFIGTIFADISAIGFLTVPLFIKKNKIWFMSISLFIFIVSIFDVSYLRALIWIYTYLMIKQITIKVSNRER